MNNVIERPQSVPITIERYFMYPENCQSIMEAVHTGLTQQQRCELSAGHIRLAGI